MTDKEMTEIAALAAGIPGHFGLGGTTNNFWREDFPGTKWDPLHDDGDAFRLAVRCNISSLSYTAEDYDYCNQDGLAATRRAIVRTIAENPAHRIVGFVKCAAGCGTDVKVMSKDEGLDHICVFCVVSKEI